MSTLSFAQIEDLWTSNGGNPLAAPIMAAIALAESGGRTDAHNTKPPDDSYGLWQINYYGALAPGRTAAYGSGAQLVADPNRQARAAIAISGNGSNYKPWSTYTNGAYRQFLGGQLPPIPGILNGNTTGSNVAAAASMATGDPADIEGYLIDLTMPSAIPNIKVSRRVVRNGVGGLVMLGGGFLAVAGVFLLRGGKAPGVSGIVQARLQRQSTQMTQEGLLQRQEARATESRARAAAKSPAGVTRSARAQGEADAAAAGDF